MNSGSSSTSNWPLEQPSSIFDFSLSCCVLLREANHATTSNPSDAFRIVGGRLLDRLVIWRTPAPGFPGLGRRGLSGISWHMDRDSRRNASFPRDMDSTDFDAPSEHGPRFVDPAQRIRRDCS